MVVKKVLWMSRHNPTQKQINELKRMFGQNVVVHQEARPFDDARQIVQHFRDGRYDEMVIVAPLSVIAVICDQGIKPFQAYSVE